MDIVDEATTHAWAWVDILAWAAGTVGEVLNLLAERFFALEGRLKLRW
jgi:hypothetical protein